LSRPPRSAAGTRKSGIQPFLRQDLPGNRCRSPWGHPGRAPVRRAPPPAGRLARRVHDRVADRDRPAPPANEDRRDAMENPAYIALSRQMVLSRQLDVIANNLANANTASYKREDLAFVEYLVKPDAAGNPTFTRADGKVAMVQDLGMMRDTDQGPMTQTDAPLDVAINGDAYFVVQTAEGPRYTRLGRFQVDANSQLVTSDGHAVQGTAGPIYIPPDDGEVKIARDGTISTIGGTVGRLNLVRFEDEQALTHAGSGLYIADELPQAAPESEVIQGMVEESNVQPIIELTQMMAVLRNFQAAQKMIDTQDEMQRRVISTVVASS
jgi:flagellar basal-body rod protein FlgF